MTLYTDMPVRRGPFFLEDYEASLGASIDATAEAASVTNPINSIMRMRELSRAERGVGNNILDFNPFGAQPPSTASPMTDAATARQRIKDEGLSLTVPDDGIRSRALDILIERKKAERQREDIINRAPTGVGASSARFATNLAVSAMDPLNIASAFIPVVGEAKYAAMLGRAGGILGRTGVRAAVGAAEGVVGAAVVEPLVYGAARQEQADYDLTDSLANIAVGTVLGGGLHVGAGAISDAVSAGHDWRTARAAPDAPIPRMMQAAPPDVRAAAIRTGVSQAVDGRELNIEPLFQLPGTMERLSEIQLGDLRTEALARFGEGEKNIVALEERQNVLSSQQVELAATAREIEATRQNVQSLRSDYAARKETLDAITPSLDEATKARLQAISEDLQKSDLPAARRSELEGERQTITESINALAEKQGTLSLGQEVEGLQRALVKQEKVLAKQEKAHAKTTKVLQQQHGEVRIGLQKERARVTSQRGDAVRYIGQSIARLARDGYRVALGRDEGERLAASLLSETDNVVAPVKLQTLTATLKKRSIALHGAQPPAAIVPSAEGLSIGRPQSLQDTARASFAPEATRLYDREAVDVADERIANAPDDETMPDVTLQEVMEDVTRLATDLGDPEIVGRELADVNELQDAAKAYGRGVLAAALCRLRRA